MAVALVKNKAMTTVFDLERKSPRIVATGDRRVRQAARIAHGFVVVGGPVVLSVQVHVCILSDCKLQDTSASKTFCMYSVQKHVHSSCNSFYVFEDLKYE